MEHFQRICHIEEVELHVDGGWRVLPGLKGLRAILQDCSLEQEKGTSAAGARTLHGIHKKERNSMHLLSWPQARGSLGWFVVPLLPRDNPV